MNKAAQDGEGVAEGSGEGDGGVGVNVRISSQDERKARLPQSRSE